MFPVNLTAHTRPALTMSDNGFVCELTASVPVLRSPPPRAARGVGRVVAKLRLQDHSADTHQGWSRFDEKGGTGIVNFMDRRRT